MITRIGIGVGTGGLRAVAVRGRRMLWAREAEIGSDEDPRAVLEALLSGVGRRWVGSPRVRVALGPAASWVQRLDGLPPLPSAHQFAQLVREGAPRFFLSGGVRLILAGVRPATAGSVWAAVLAAPCVEAMASACRRCGFGTPWLAPVAVALRHATPDDQIEWRDGPLRLRVRWAAGRIVEVRRWRAAAGATEPDTPRLVAELNRLGPDAWRFADAFGAAVMPGTEPLLLRGSRWVGTGSEVPSRRVAAAGAACAVSVLLALIAPPVVAVHDASRAAERLAALEESAAIASRAEREIEAVTAELAALAGFAAGRRPVTSMLDELARALPDSSAIIAVRVDSLGGELVALAPRAAAVLGPLERAPAIGSVEIVGPVTRQRIGDMQLERVSLRFSPRRTGGRRLP